MLTRDYRNTLPDGPEKIKRYRDRLYVLDNEVMYDFRVVVPESLRKDVTEGLNAAHQGVGCMLARAQDMVFWPGSYGDLKAVRAKCTV